MDDRIFQKKCSGFAKVQKTKHIWNGEKKTWRRVFPQKQDVHQLKETYGKNVSVR